MKCKEPTTASTVPNHTLPHKRNRRATRADAPRTQVLRICGYKFVAPKCSVPGNSAWWGGKDGVVDFALVESGANPH
jgi:hypothetical protein